MRPQRHASAVRRTAIACVLLLPLLAGCANPAAQTGNAATAATGDNPTQGTAFTSQCPGHYHVTFALFVPGADGSPTRVDFQSPKTPDGAPYYDLQSAYGGGGDPRMTIGLHMHQQGGEVGAAALGPFQWHMEGGCVNVEQALAAVEADVDTDGWTLTGGHGQVPGQAGRFQATPDAPLRWFVQAHTDTDTWDWREVPWGTLAGAQMRDGSSLVGALGHYTDAQVQAMESQVPAPSSRQ